jgi:hypothetical protein
MGSTIGDEGSRGAEFSRGPLLNTKLIEIYDERFRPLEYQDRWSADSTAGVLPRLAGHGVGWRSAAVGVPRSLRVYRDGVALPRYRAVLSP